MVIGRRGTEGEFEGDDVVPLRGSAKRRGGSLTPPWKCPVYREDFSREFARRDTRRTKKEAS
jgi:hypothetical protein